MMNMPMPSLAWLAAAAVARARSHPRKPCQLCATQSARHPAGPLRRYTRTRDRHGRPQCHRHPNPAKEPSL